jgi:hypothetical protein
MNILVRSCVLSADRTQRIYIFQCVTDDAVLIIRQLVISNELYAIEIHNTNWVEFRKALIAEGCLSLPIDRLHFASVRNDCTRLCINSIGYPVELEDVTNGN